MRNGFDRVSILGFLKTQRQVATFLFGCFTQLYGAVVSLAFAPYILATIGPEAYGLVGLFLIVQTWFQLLDSGLTPALTREAARFRGGAVSASSLRGTVVGLEALVLITSIPILLAFYLVAEFVATDWVQRETLTIKETVFAVNLIGLILIARWVAGVRRAVLTGFERHKTLYLVTTMVATLRYPCIVVFFYFVDASVSAYFLYQLAISLIEVLTLWLCSRRLVPDAPRVGWVKSIASLRGIAAFAASHGLLALLWLPITQTDKAILSKTLTLSQFGYFSLAVAAAYGANLITVPISQMLMPRLSRMSAQQDNEAMFSVYRRSTRAVMILLSSITALFFGFGSEVMFAWTADPKIALATGSVLAWYTLGNAAMAVSTFSYYFQYALGKVRLHTMGLVILLAFLVPAFLWSTNRYGMNGAAVTWAVAWIAFLLIWVTLAHRELLGGLHWRWLGGDVLRIALPVAIVCAALKALVPLPTDRLDLVMVLVTIGGVLFVVATLSSGLLSWAMFRRDTAVASTD